MPTIVLKDRDGEDQTYENVKQVVFSNESGEPVTYTYGSGGSGVSDVKVNGTSVVTDEVANINDSDLQQVKYTSQSLTDQQKTQARTNIGAVSEDDVPEVINNVTSTSTDDALSANMGKELQDQINNIKSIGRFLSLWDCTTGLPETNPVSTLPYTYHTGDYFRVSNVGNTYKHVITMKDNNVYESDRFNVVITLYSDTNNVFTVEDLYNWLVGKGSYYNITGTIGTHEAKAIEANNDISSRYYNKIGIGYISGGWSFIMYQKTDCIIESDIVTTTILYKPNGTQYNGTASTTVETGNVTVGAVYYYDGANWNLQTSSGGGTVQDVQLDGTSVLDSGSGIANITSSNIVSVSSSGTSTDEVKYITIGGVEKKIGEEVFLAIIGTTTLAQLQTAYAQGKILVGVGDQYNMGRLINYSLLDAHYMAQGVPQEISGYYISSNVTYGNYGLQALETIKIRWDSTYPTGKITSDYVFYASAMDSDVSNRNLGSIVRNTSDSNRLYIGDGTTANKIAYYSDIEEALGSIEQALAAL